MHCYIHFQCIHFENRSGCRERGQEGERVSLRRECQIEPTVDKNVGCTIPIRSEMLGIIEFLKFRWWKVPYLTDACR